MGSIDGGELDFSSEMMEEVAEFVKKGFHFVVGEGAGCPFMGIVRLPEITPRWGDKAPCGFGRPGNESVHPRPVAFCGVRVPVGVERA